ncbi:TetR/AcrR family transcriptional regulator [Nonomuraea sp. H19]|uniref:TetR/AcrR family transcriptional regulator n=1 Tax=Nonomuraea sp. H19 TaxID=3452206 RepID=UPI003F8B4C00
MKRTSPGYHHGNLRSALIEAALDLARDKGVGALGLREVTRAVGVSPNAAYRHFADLRALVLTVALEARHRLAHAILDRLDTITPGLDVGPRSTERLRAFGLAYVEYAQATPGWYELACASQEAPPDGAEEGGPPPPHLVLLGILDEMTRAGVMASTRRTDAEWSCWATVHGLAELRVHGPLQALSGEESVRLARLALDTLILGLTAKS